MKLFGRGKNKKKLGLGLGGGGAKGSVHLGALRAFEEEGVSFDVVAGTSIGSFIGALYARGYSAGEIESILIGSNLDDVRSFLMARISGVGIDGILAKSTGNLDFEDLKIPYAAVAVDLASGEKVVFTDGVLSKCMGASCAIPPYFKAVEYLGRRFVDGAFADVVPCDVARELGADFVIGIDLTGNRQSSERSKRSLDEMYPNNGVRVCNPSEEGYAACDYMLTPDLVGFGATSVNAMGEMFDIGYFLAKEHMKDIKAALKKAGFSSEN